MSWSVFNVSYNHMYQRLQILLLSLFLFPLLILSFPKFSSGRVVYGRSFSIDPLLLYWSPVHVMVRGGGMRTFCNLQIKTPSFRGPMPWYRDLRVFLPWYGFFFLPTLSSSHSCHILMYFLEALVLVDCSPLLRRYRKARNVLVGGRSFLQLE